MQVSAIIQARMGSTRLPGKVMKKLNGISLLECQLSQLHYCRLLDKIIIATTTNPEDNIIEKIVNSKDIQCFRGNSIDVLDRYFQCAKTFNLKHIARITSDCPLIDPTIVDQAIEIYNNETYDYVNNFSKRSFPSGTEVEIISFNTLEKTWKEAKKPSEREHVTPYIYNNPMKFKIGRLEYKTNISNLHWTVDRIEDFELVKKLYQKINKKPILLADILNLIKKEPSLLEINKKTNPHEGHVKSLEDE